MIAQGISILISSILLLVFVLLFRIEDARGARFFRKYRTYLDMWVLRYSKSLKRLSAYVERDLVRQLLHYFLHTVLVSILLFLKSSEVCLRNWLHVNKSHAARVHAVRSQKSIFDEIAEHKVATALTARERKKAKEHSIGGKL